MGKHARFRYHEETGSIVVVDSTILCGHAINPVTTIDLTHLVAWGRSLALRTQNRTQVGKITSLNIWIKYPYISKMTRLWDLPRPGSKDSIMIQWNSCRLKISKMCRLSKILVFFSSKLHWFCQIAVFSSSSLDVEQAFLAKFWQEPLEKQISEKVANCQSINCQVSDVTETGARH